jgi:hypothetical protein
VAKQLAAPAGRFPKVEKHGEHLGTRSKPDWYPGYWAGTSRFLQGFGRWIALSGPGELSLVVEKARKGFAE